MFRIVQTISQEITSTIVDYLNEVIEPQLGTDVSSYAFGRRRSWLEYEAPLSQSQPWQLGVRDDRIWSYVTRICGRHGFSPDIGLVSKGGLIEEHRDASFSNYLAMGINLGECTWEYRHCYPEYRYTPQQNESAPVETYHLTGGEVFFFNCKNPHAVTQVSPDRWAFNLWTISKKGMDGFTSIKEANS